jgi:hypothetical protein
MTREAIVNIDEVILNIKELTEDIQNSSDFVKNLKGNDKKLFNNILKRIQRDTNGEFTQTEYEGLAKMTLFCDRVETLMELNGVENIDTSLFDLYRKMKTQIVAFMRDYRDGRKQAPPSIKQINVYFDKNRDIIDEIEKSVFVDVDAVIIEDVKDANVIQPEKNETDGDSGKRVEDKDST